MIEFFLIVILPVLLAYCHDGVKDIQRLSRPHWLEAKNGFEENELIPDQFNYSEAAIIWFGKVLWIRIAVYWTRLFRL